MVKLFFLLLFVSNLSCAELLTLDNVVATADAKIREFMDSAKAKANAFVELSKNPRSELLKNSYTSPKAELVTSQGDSLVLDFGYGGHGSLFEGFKDRSSKIVLKGLPEGLGGPVGKVVEKLGSVKLMKFSAKQIGLLKLVLLAKYRLDGKMILGEFVVNLNALLMRFMRTPGFETFSKSFDDVFPPFCQS